LYAYFLRLGKEASDKYLPIVGWTVLARYKTDTSGGKHLLSKGKELWEEEEVVRSWG
jgi:hypothetical protein